MAPSERVGSAGARRAEANISSSAASASATAANIVLPAGGISGAISDPAQAARAELAALELMFASARRAPAEPTRSLGAIALVLFAGQLTDAARFLVLALAVASGEPALAAVGGALGSGAVLTAGWALGEDWEKHLFMRTIRLAATALFVVAALATGLAARGVIA